MTKHPSDLYRANSPRSAAWIAASLVAVCAFAWTAREFVLIAPADWRSALVGLKVARWAAEEVVWTDDQWDEARQQLEKAVELTPDNPVALEHLAQLYTVRGRARWGAGEETSPGVADFRTARDIQRRVVALRPLYPNPWANLANMQFAVNSTVDEMYAPWREALRLGPNEPEVRTTLRFLVEQTWEIAPKDALDWLEREWPGSLTRLQNEAAQGEAGVTQTK